MNNISVLARSIIKTLPKLSQANYCGYLVPLQYVGRPTSFRKIPCEYIGNRAKLQRNISTYNPMMCEKPPRRPKGSSQLSIQGYFDHKKKNRESFIEAVNMFTEREKLRRGHIEFIMAALGRLEEYGLEKDLEVYKALLDVFPKGTMVCQNSLQREFQHYIKHQECALNVLEEMEYFGVMPDKECQLILLNVFGSGTQPHKKVARMAYWMPKFKNATPWPLAEILPTDAKDLARLALERMATVDPAYKIMEWESSEVEDSIDDTWILSALTPTQKQLLENLPRLEPIKVEGPFGIFLREQRVAYFILRADSKPPPPPRTVKESDNIGNIFLWMTGEGKPEDMELIKGRSVHEQDDGTILALCATGSSSRDSLLSWIRLLENHVPNMKGITVMFDQFSPIGEVIVPEEKDSDVLKTEQG